MKINNYLEFTYANLIRALELNNVYWGPENINTKCDLNIAISTMKDFIPAILSENAKKTRYGAKYKNFEYRIPKGDAIDTPYFNMIVSMLNLPTNSEFTPGIYDLNNESPSVKDCAEIFNNYIEKGYNEHFDNKSIKEILEEIDLQYDIDKSIDEVEIGG